MVKREREGGNAPQVDSLLIENAFHSSIVFLGSHGELRERESGTEIVASGSSGIEISIVSGFSMKDLQTLSRLGSRRMEDIILEGASRICVSRGETQPDMVVAGNAGKFNRENKWTNKRTELS